MSLSCFTSHGFFFSPLKRPPNHKHCNLTAEYKAMDQMFADKLSNLVHKSMLHGRIRLPFFLLWYIFFVGCLCFSSGFLVFRGLYWRYFLAFIFLHSTVTIPRQPRGWTPAWQRRQSPLRSARMAVCILLCSAGFLKRTLIPLNTAHAFTQGHTYIVYALLYMSHHFSPFLTMNQATNQDEIWMFDFSLKWHIT